MDDERSEGPKRSDFQDDFNADDKIQDVEYDDVESDDVEYHDVSREENKAILYF